MSVIQSVASLRIVGLWCTASYLLCAPQALAQSTQGQKAPQGQGDERAEPANAQQQDQQQQPSQNMRQDQNDVVPQPTIDEGEPTPVDGSNLVVQPHMQADERPEPPGSEQVDALRDRENTPVVTGAGVGSDVAYASRGVVELGGALAITSQSDTFTMRLTPLLGYFFIDNLELTLFPELTVVNVDDETDVTVGGALEPSYHLPFNDRLFGFVGLGLGVRYAKDPGVDLFLRPRLGMDFMVGRSGILKPALFLDVGTHDGLTAGGGEVGFTVML